VAPESVAEDRLQTLSVTREILRVPMRPKKGHCCVFLIDCAAQMHEIEHSPRLDRRTRRSRGLPRNHRQGFLQCCRRPAEADRRQITRGLAGEPRAALKARLLLRELFGGEIRLVPDGQCGLVAHSNLHTAALLRDVGTVGSGGRLRSTACFNAFIGRLERRRPASVVRGDGGPRSVQAHQRPA
jgi:hypothetical protein